MHHYEFCTLYMAKVHMNVHDVCVGFLSSIIFLKINYLLEHVSVSQ